MVDVEAVGGDGDGQQLGEQGASVGEGIVVEDGSEEELSDADMNRSLVNAKATTMMEIQVENDRLSDLILQYIWLSADPVEAASEVDEFINPSIQDRLMNGSWSSISSSSVMLSSSSGGEGDSSSEAVEEADGRRTGLVPFKCAQKEKRIQSYKMR